MPTTAPAKRSLRVEIDHIEMRRHMLAALDVERLCFGGLAWTEEELRAALWNGFGLVARLRGTATVVGYAVGELVPASHPEALPVLDVTRLGVHPSYRYWRVGSDLIDAMRGVAGNLKSVGLLTDHAAAEGLRAVVREDNLPALKFLRACRLRAVALHREPWAAEFGGDGIEMRWPTACEKGE